jgi:uncharacterized membrane protein
MDALWVVLLGGVLGGLLTWVVDPNPAPALVLAAAALGAVLTNAIRSAVGWRS